MLRVLLASLLVSACVQTPGPATTPPADRERDAVVDVLDACPDVPGITAGCAPDIDGDGVVNADDRCPTEPETRNGYQDEDGCPDEIPVALAKFTGTIKGIYFDARRATIKPTELPVLDRGMAILNEFNTIRVEIAGHTDSHEKSAAKLSLKRAQVVQRYLIEKGVDAGRMEVRGAGPDEPIDTNRTAAGRARNRRIEFVILVQ